MLDIYTTGGRAAFVEPQLQALGLGSNLEDFDPAAEGVSNTAGDRQSADAAALRERLPENIDGSDFDDSQAVLESLKSLQYGNNDSDYHLQFFYFGDLLEIAMENVHSEQPPIEANGENGEEGSYGSRNQLDENLRIILGPISYELNRKTENQDESPKYTRELIYDINLADIPISVHYFIDWFLTKIVAQERALYPVLSFIREVASDLIANAMRSQSGAERNVARQELQLRTNFFTAAGGGEDNTEKLFTLKNAPPIDITELSPTTDPEELQTQSEATSRQKTRIDLDSVDLDQRPILRPPQSLGNSYDYMLLYAIRSGPVEDLDGDRANDRDRGIYHFGIGKPEGIIKRINFSKSDIPFIRESRLEQEFLGQITGLAVLANVYNVTIECYGTTAFHPGMKIYVDPAGLARDIGRPTTRGTASSVLGIGGYHVITKVKSSIQRGVFKTTLTAIWESAGASVVDPGQSVSGEEAVDCDENRREIKSLIRNMR